MIVVSQGHNGVLLSGCTCPGASASLCRMMAKAFPCMIIEESAENSRVKELPWSCVNGGLMIREKDPVLK